jgi:toxin ParE1/3/4
MKYKIRITEEAEQDILDIYYYVASSDSEESAITLIDHLEEKCISLAELPNRGHAPPELKDIAVKDYQEVHFKPYRIIYQIIDKTIYIHCIVDGRRDMQSLLEHRIIR